MLKANIFIIFSWKFPVKINERKVAGQLLGQKKEGLSESNMWMSWTGFGNDRVPHIPQKFTLSKSEVFYSKMQIILLRPSNLLFKWKGVFSYIIFSVHADTI